MLKLYVPQCKEKSIIDPLKGVLNDTHTSVNIFGETDIWKDYQLPVVVVNDPALADYICIPHAWSIIMHEQDYINQIANSALQYSKKVIVFVIGDTHEYVVFPDHKIPLVVLRMSQYRDRILKNEVVIPAYAHDLALKAKVADGDCFQTVPTVSFCGWAHVAGFKLQLSFFLKSIMWSMLGVARSHLKSRRPGVLIRKQGIDVLKKITLVKAELIIRTSYTGSKKTTVGDPQKLRTEYINNMLSSTYAFTPKGDGNFSVRFFEALSLGRIPVIPDTQIALPLENIISYDDFVIKVPLDKLNKIDKEILTWHANRGPDGIVEARKKARQAFDQYLNVRVFCSYVFTREFLDQVETER